MFYIKNGSELFSTFFLALLFEKRKKNYKNINLDIPNTEGGDWAWSCQYNEQLAPHLWHGAVQAGPQE